MRHLWISLIAVMSASSCVGTTGGSVVDFTASAAGPADATGGTFTFVTDRGWTVALTSATLHVGALYLDQSVPTSGAGLTDCILPGTYVAEVTSGLDVNLLSPTAKPFLTPGHGTTGRAALAQIWLSGGDVNANDDATPILVLAGTATRASDVRAFSGVITISENRSTTGALAGADPPCKHRIVSVPLPRPLSLSSTGTLLMRVDPRQLFADVDFGQLTKMAPDGTTYLFQDNSNDSPSSNLYSNLRTGGSLYSFAWIQND